MSAATHARLTELFTHAIGMDSEARVALLKEVRACDRELAAELAALLAADASAEVGLDTGGLLPTLALRGPNLRATDLVIPGYQITAVLGEGGMGTVYTGWQMAPRRRVAIKVLRVRSGAALARFRAEAEIMARLDHPGIARVLEAGDAHGRPFLVLEHVDGVTLDRYVAGRSRADRIAVMLALCDAVHHAHGKSVVHRDLKPANVMVRLDGRVAVLDFGIARFAADDCSAAGETQAGDLIGTPLYMSPEQARLRPDEVDARSDVYTLGVMLYELLCGSLPYDSHRLPLPQLTAAIREHEPVPLGRHDPALRGDLEAITGKALSKAPSERYPSAAALADDLRRHLAGLPISARAIGAVERMHRFVRRRPRLALAIGAALGVAAAVAVAVTVLWGAARHARGDADAAHAMTQVARGELASRTDQVTLRQAHAALASDPTEAVAWLATLSGHDLDPNAAWAIADEALGRGVAHDVWHEHSGEVRWIESFPASDDFVTGAYDGRVIVWEAPAFRPRLAFQAKQGRIHAARPSPDGTMIAVGGDSGALEVIRRDGHMIATLSGHAGKVERIAWSRDGALAAGDDRGNLWLWPRVGEPGRRLLGSDAVIGSVEFAASGRALVVGDHRGAVWLWDLAADRVSAATVAAEVVDSWTDGEQVRAVDARGAVHRWHVAGGILVADRSVDTGLAAKRGVFANDGTWVVLGGVGGTATLVEGEATAAIATHAAEVRCVAISPDGQQVATASDDGILQVLDRGTGRRRTLRGHRDRIRHLAFARSALLSSDGDGVVRRWELAAIPPIVLDGRGARLQHLAASPDGKRLASIDTEGEVVLWTLATGARQRRGRVHGHVSAIATTGEVVVTGTVEGDVTWWADRPITRHVASVVRAIAIGADRIAVATAAGPIALFTLAGQPCGELAGNLGGTEVIEFDPTRTLLAAGGQDRAIRVWRRYGEGLAPWATLPGPTGDTHFLAFSPAGDRLFTAGNDGAVLAWRVSDRAIDPDSRMTLARHTGSVTALAVSADGRFVASSGRDDAIVRVALATTVAQRFAFGAAATLLAFDPTGAVYAVTRTGAVMAPAPDGTTTTLEQAVGRAATIGAGHVALALDDGAILIEPVATRSLAELRAALARATRYTHAR